MNKELISSQATNPFKIEYLNLGSTKGHWHSNLEIIFVLLGNLTVVINDKRHLLNDEDILVINRNTVHSLMSQTGCIAISVQFALQGVNDNSLVFDCNSSIDANKGNYYNLKHIIAKIIKTNSSENTENYYQNMSFYYQLLFELNLNFKITEDTYVQTKKYLSRLTTIIDYIDSHYKEAITLNQLADVVNLSVPYLSAFFEKYIGTNFLTYYNNLRLERAVNELLSSDESVEAVAYNNGFTDSRSFVTLFKKQYNTLPSIYRREQGKTKNIPIKNIDNKSFENDGYLSILAKYLPEADSHPEENIPSNVVPQTASTVKPSGIHFNSDFKILSKENIDISKGKKRLKHSFKKMTSISRAKELLYSETQHMLRQLQKDVGYEYIKFHGLFSGDMLVYDEDDKGNPIYSFVYIDKIFDFLASIKLKPLVEFSFTPPPYVFR